MKWIRNDPEKVKENIRKKFQDEKLPLVDEVVELDQKFREAKVQGDELRSQRKSISKKIGALMGQGKRKKPKLSRQRWVPSAPSWKNWKRQKQNYLPVSARSCW